jgi:hypothetical protein
VTTVNGLAAGSWDARARGAMGNYGGLRGDEAESKSSEGALEGSAKQS